MNALIQEKIVKNFIKDAVKKGLFSDETQSCSGVVNTTMGIKVAQDETTTHSGTNLLELEVVHDFSCYIQTEFFLASFVVKLELSPLTDTEDCNFKNVDIHDLCPIFWSEDSLEEDYPSEYVIYGSKHKERLERMANNGSLKTEVISVLNSLVRDKPSLSQSILTNLLHEENKKAIQKVIQTQQDLLTNSLLGM